MTVIYCKGPKEKPSIRVVNFRLKPSRPNLHHVYKVNSDKT